MRTRLVFRTVIVAALLLATSLPGIAGSPKKRDDLVGTFHEQVPLGIIGFFVRPARRTVYVMSTARSPVFEGLQMFVHEGQRAITTAGGTPVHFYPRQVQFRVTASAMEPQLMEVDRDFLDNISDLNGFLLKLGFRLKIFHGLQVTSVEPQSVEMIGMPADVAYDERIFQAKFRLPEVPIEDRIVLEVLTPDGERLCKFHLEF